MPHPDYNAYDGYALPDDDDRPWPLTEEAAARFAGVSRRTIRGWRAAGTLKPDPRSLEVVGQYLYWPADVAAAERANRDGRGRRGDDWPGRKAG